MIESPKRQISTFLISLIILITLITLPGITSSAGHNDETSSLIPD